MQQLHIGRKCPPAVDDNPFREPFHVVLVGDAEDLDVVFALDLVAWVRQACREIAIAREQQQTLRVVVEPTDRIHVVAYAALLQQIKRGLVTPEQAHGLEPWARYWYFYISATFLGAYLEEIGKAGLLPKESTELEILLRAYLLDKAIYELGYELNNRPDWVKIPLQGILQLLEGPTL